MGALLIRWILNTLALAVVAKVVPNFYYRDWVALAIAAAVLGLLNATVKPILTFLTFPLTVITLGLFLIVLNALMLELTDAIMGPAFDVRGFGWALLGALLLAAVSTITNAIGPSREEKR